MLGDAPDFCEYAAYDNFAFYWDVRGFGPFPDGGFEDVILSSLGGCWWVRVIFTFESTNSFCCSFISSRADGPLAAIKGDALLDRFGDWLALPDPDDF